MLHSTPSDAPIEVCIAALSARLRLDCQHLHAVQQDIEVASAVCDSVPDKDMLLAGHNGDFCDALHCIPDHDLVANYEAHKVLSTQAAQWMDAALSCNHDDVTPVSLKHVPGGVNSKRINTASVAGSFFPAAMRGVVLYEPFGGMCSGLEMLLRNQIPIMRYLCSDVDASVRQIARHRIKTLMAEHPTLLSAAAVECAFSALPQDVREVGATALIAAGVLTGEQWIVVGGWECQDLSPAGKCKGLNGPRSNTFYDLISIIKLLQSMQQALPPAYVLENTAFQYNFNSPNISKAEFELINSLIGAPVVIDAARFGSRAHRLRNFWQNLCPTHIMQYAVHAAVRPTGLTVQQILDPERLASPVTSSDQLPYYVCNFEGQPRAALPTLMAYTNSRNFRVGRAGVIWDSTHNRWDEPNVKERELALGYAADSTAASGVSDLIRHEVTGRCMDANCMQSLFAIATAHHLAMLQPPIGLSSSRHRGGNSVHLHFNQADNASGLRFSSALCVCMPSVAVDQYVAVTTTVVVALTAESQDALPENRKSPDIWHDEVALHQLEHAEYPVDATATERNRVQKRLRYYRMEGDKLYRVMPDGSTHCTQAC
eukprot:jgi/Chrzof1/2040/UNPLg00696.t1